LLPPRNVWPGCHMPGGYNRGPPTLGGGGVWAFNLEEFRIVAIGELEERGYEHGLWVVEPVD
jgi:hypothetical protein